MMILRRLNDEGVARFAAFLSSVDGDAPREVPLDALTDPTTSEALPVDVEVEDRGFDSRFELAEYVHGIFEAAGIQAVGKDRGLWVWLALYWFERICPKGPGQRWKPGAQARWILQSDVWRRYYRHLLASPYMIYRMHSDDPKRAMSLLTNPITKPGDIPEQFASRQEMVTSKALIGAATALYVDSSTGKLKRGAGAKGPGSARRLSQVIGQFDLTWDLQLMTSEELLAILPSEFDRFRDKNESSPSVAPVNS